MTVWRPPAQFNRVQVSRDLLHETLDHLDEGLDREAIAYWAGTQDGEDVRVTRLIRPTAYRGRRFVFVPVEEVSEVVNECMSFGDFLVVQLHTHPADEDHSEVDECGTVSKRDGFVSLVLPFYARSSTLSSSPRCLDRCRMNRAVLRPGLDRRAKLPITTNCVVGAGSCR